MVGKSEASCRTVGQLWNPGQTVEPWVNCGTTSERLEPRVIGSTPGKGRPGRWRDLGHWSSVEPWANCGTLGQLWNPGPTVEPWVIRATSGKASLGLGHWSVLSPRRSAVRSIAARTRCTEAIIDFDRKTHWSNHSVDHKT